MSLPDFLLCFPIQTIGHSNGGQALVELTRSITRAGRAARICVTDSYPHDEEVVRVDLTRFQPTNEAQRAFCETVLRLTEELGLTLQQDFDRVSLDACYVLYPEVILGNPLQARRVIRYFGNKDGILKQGRAVQAGQRDFLLGHSRVVAPNADHICFFARQNPLFHRLDTHEARYRRLDLTYVGKGELYGMGGCVDNTVEITRLWPTSKTQLAMLLRNCRFFYTGDAWSNINVEALACGAIPVFLALGPWTNEEIDGSELGVLPRLTPGVALSESLFSEFEVARAALLDRVAEVDARWDASVVELIHKVDRHFGCP